MAIRLPDGEFVDPFGGVKDLAAKRLDTPLDPEIAFSDDPLRMLRAARFAAQLELVPAPRVVRAIEQMHDRLEIVSAERISEELTKLLLAEAPSRGLELVVATGLAAGVPAGARGAAARAGPRAQAQGRAASHVRGGREDRGDRRSDAPARGAAPRHRQAEDARDHARRRLLPPSRGRRARAWRANASRRCGTRRTWWTTSPGSSRCTCASTATPSGATARSAGTCVTRGRCSTS